MNLRAPLLQIAARKPSDPCFCARLSGAHPWQHDVGIRERHRQLAPPLEAARRGGEEDYASRRSGGGRRRSPPPSRNAARDKKRRRGRPAWLRSPNDSPYRDGNRDRLIGLLTERSARTLAYYLSETNLNLYHWLLAFIRQNPIPRTGAWDDVSGETFLRTLLSMPVQAAKFRTGRDSMYDNVHGMGVDPRSIAQRIMEIRKQLAKEWVSDLNGVSEENASLLRESLSSSLEKMFAAPVTIASDDEGERVHPDMVDDDQALD